MAGVDPYSPCPCGSGQKLKWCCLKAEPYAERSMRLLEGNQAEASLDALDDGLRRLPNNPWLALRKAALLADLNRNEEGLATVEALHRAHPENVAAILMRLSFRLGTSSEESVQALQDTLDIVPDKELHRIIPMIRDIVQQLLEDDRVVAAREHTLFIIAMAGSRETPVGSPEWVRLRHEMLRPIDGSPEIAPFLKDDRDCLPAPEGTPADLSVRFEEGLSLVRKGRFRAAMAVFHRLVAEAGAGTPAAGVAEYNEGLCRLFLGDHKGAVVLLRRRVAALGPTVEAVDLELLCQMIEPVRSADRVEYVQWLWPVRNQDGLLAALRSQPDLLEAGEDVFDPTDEASTKAAVFELLDRPALKEWPAESPAFDQIPLILGRLFVAKEQVALTGSDDGRLEPLRDRFMAVAGPTIVPAHPKTKVLHEQSRSTLSVSWEWQVPRSSPQVELLRLRDAKKADLLMKVWPVMPKPYLNGRTPVQAATLPEGQVPLRAAIRNIELSSLHEGAVEFGTMLRELLKLPAEPKVDLSQTDLDHVPISRLSQIDLATASVPDAVGVLTLAQTYSLPLLIARTAERLLAASDEDLVAAKLPRFRVFEALLVYHEMLGEYDKATEYALKGREADPDRLVPFNAMGWDFAELMLKMSTKPPAEWVPDLSVILERYSQIEECARFLSMRLVALRLIELVPHPEREEDFLLDTRRLQTLLSLYGPKVRTAAGELGVSASRPAIWTPGSATPSAPGGGGIWTPGSSSAPAQPAAQKSPLILPGR